MGWFFTSSSRVVGDLFGALADLNGLESTSPNSLWQMASFGVPTSWSHRWFFKSPVLQAFLIAWKLGKNMKNHLGNGKEQYTFGVLFYPGTTWSTWSLKKPPFPTKAEATQRFWDKAGFPMDVQRQHLGMVWVPPPWKQESHQILMTFWRNKFLSTSR